MDMNAREELEALVADAGSALTLADAEYRVLPTEKNKQKRAEAAERYAALRHRLEQCGPRPAIDRRRLRFPPRPE